MSNVMTEFLNVVISLILMKEANLVRFSSSSKNSDKVRSGIAYQWDAIRKRKKSVQNIGRDFW